MVVWGVGLVEGDDLLPFGERSVGCDERAGVLVATGDEFEEQVGMAVGVGEITDLVDNEETGRA